MHYGLTVFPTDYAIAIPELARAAEERGFESLWVSEHSHIPASRRTPWPPAVASSRGCTTTRSTPSWHWPRRPW